MAGEWLGDDFEMRMARAGLLTALLERVGYTFWQLSECEDAVAQYLVVRLKATKGMGEEPGTKLLESVRRRTFGSLLKELRDNGVLPPALQGRIEELLEERNWLVHRSKRESRGVLFKSEQFDQLVARLATIADEALAVQKLVAEAIEEYVVGNGVDRAQIETEAARVVREWGWV